MSAKPDKEAMKRLREERRAQVERAQAAIKKQAAEMKKVKEKLAGQGATAPDIARATGLPAARVLWWVAALKKYGEAVEGEKSGDYYLYRLAETAGGEEA